jgi:hypothetical protein
VVGIRVVLVAGGVVPGVVPDTSVSEFLDAVVGLFPGVVPVTSVTFSDSVVICDCSVPCDDVVLILPVVVDAVDA